MEKYLNLNRRFGHLVNFDTTELLATAFGRTQMSWSQLLEGRYSIVIGSANFGKTFEFKAQSGVLRAAGRSSLYVALHRVLGEDEIEDALEVADREALEAWRKTGGEIVAFVDSLDEVSLTGENGIRKALRGVAKALNWPNSDVKWVLSSRPAVLTDEVLGQLLAELRTTLFTPKQDEFEAGLDDETPEQPTAGDDAPSTGNIEPSDAKSKLTNKVVKQEKLKVYALLPLDKAAAALYLSERVGVSNAKETLHAARQYGLARLADSPGGLDILGYVDPVQNPPKSLTQVFEKMAGAMQQQQRVDPRERRLPDSAPADFEDAIQRLASASMVCGLPNIELSQSALRHREGVLSARPIVASVLSESSLQYLLGSRLFIDSGQHQVKLYPDDLLPFLAAKQLASLATSPDQARRLLSNFTWSSTTGECGVSRPLLTLAGWLSVFSTHCRKELLEIEPQAVAFFGDLRNPEISLGEAEVALERSLERLVSGGDSIGRQYFTLTPENYWQVAKPNIAPTLMRLFQQFGTDFYARDVLLSVAGYASLDVFRQPVLDTHQGDYVRVMGDSTDLAYILRLARQEDFDSLSTAVMVAPDLSESRLSTLIGRLAWRPLGAKSIAILVANRFGGERLGYSISATLTHSVADTASDLDLYRLTRSLLVRHMKLKVKTGRSSERYRSDQKFMELVMDLLALLIQRPSACVNRTVKLCLVLNRFSSKQFYGHAGKKNISAALKDNKTVRQAFLRTMIQSTDKSEDGIFEVAFSHSTICPKVEGDELELNEPGLFQLFETVKRNAAQLPKPPTQHVKALTIDRKFKAALQADIVPIQSGTAANAFARIAEWLHCTIEDARYGECNFAMFEKAAPAAIAKAVREGLSNFWRQTDPTWNESEAHSTYYVTVAGLQGLFLDLGDGGDVSRLSALEVRRAIRYAMFEINGYPKWFWKLVAAHPTVALSELNSVITRAGKGPVSQQKAETLIQNLDDAPVEIRQSLARPSWDFVRSTASVGEYTSKVALRVAAAGSDVIDQTTFEFEALRLMRAAFSTKLPSSEDAATMSSKDAAALQALITELTRQRENALTWGSLWLCTYPGAFAEAWEVWRAEYRPSAEDFMLALAAQLGEERGARLKLVADKGREGLDVLKALYDWTHFLVNESEDQRHDDGRPYSPNDRDHAEQLRDAVVPAISHAKSEHAYQILEELRLGASSKTAKYLRHVQFMMREDQFAKSPIEQVDYLEFERQLAPTVSGYKTFAMAVENDLLTVKSQIETGDFSLRRFFNSVSFDRIKTDNDGLALEEDFQSLLGSELNHAAADRYVVALEPILPGGTRRDVLCQSGSLRATVELKMSLRWTVDDYIEALEEQLQGQYMMAENSKIGFFIIVLQKRRTWKAPDGGNIDFEGLLSVLRQKAREKEAADSSLFLRVIGIDASPKVDFREVRAAKAKAKKSVTQK